MADYFYCSNDLTSNIILTGDDWITHNQKGELIVSAKDSEIHPSLKLNDLLKHIKKGNTGQYEIIHNARRIVVDYAAIPTLSWYYIELIDIEKYLSE